MRRISLIRCLSFINYAVGTIICFSSLYLSRQHKTVAPLYIALAILTAGPLEDALVRSIESSGSISRQDKDRYIALVDQITSLGFLIFLLLAVLRFFM